MIMLARARCFTRPSGLENRNSGSRSRGRALGVLACFLLVAACTGVQPETADPAAPGSARVTVDAGATLAHELVDARGAGWWSDHKKRFQELAICALASANITYMLVAGFTGPGAVIGFLVSAVGVAVCL